MGRPAFESFAHKARCSRFDGQLADHRGARLPRFVFWNINKRDIGSLVAGLARSHDADVIVLAECPMPPERILEALNEASPDYHYAYGLSDDIRFFTKFEASFLSPVYERSDLSVRRLRLPARQELLIVAAHLPSKLFHTGESLHEECIDLARIISESEDAVGHYRTVVLGDLNVNPFEAGVVGAVGLHAVMSRDIAARMSRTVRGRQHRFFFNPMWGHIGERNDGPPGTYYYERAENVNYFWNVFDQILIRPELLGTFKNEDVRVLTRAGDVELVNAAGRPNRQAASDHLPVLLDLDF